MPKNIVLDRDPSAGHGSFLPTKANATSTVTINGKAVVCVDDLYDQHCALVCHTPKAKTSSSTITITVGGVAKKIMLSGDALDCGDTATSSSNVSVS